ncbi:MAG: nucleotidyltransferase domain-containing protein [Anaerolineales bacterium]
MTVYVPPVTKRKRIPQAAIDDVVRQIVEKFHPQKIILFGSYARGNFRPESDVDLFVVMETLLKPVRQEIEISRQLDYEFGLDLLVYTPDTLKERLALGDSFLREIIRDGKTVYESTGG